jgi:FlaA1/EpsC-like NDP-sugar epimerase
MRIDARPASPQRPTPEQLGIERLEPDWAPNRASPSIYTFTVISPLNDLNWRSFLGRPPLSSPPPDGIEALRQQPILITGAGGSIGSALALRLAALAPSMLVLLEASESNLYALQRDWAELQTANPRASCPMAPVLGSVADQPLLDEIFALHAPLIVFHAAAFKHVPLMEEQPLAAISNNVFATQTLTETATAHGARVVLLSTDKAVQPASVMGATKRVAEQIVLSSGGTTLRLANVLASRDSVAEVFTRQIAQGGPVTVTDPAARRYFVTLDEAVNLLLIAAAHPKPGTLLAPVLPATHFIADLARFMVRELAPSREIPIEFTGLRPGDKETELLWPSGASTFPTNLAGVVCVETPLLSAPQLAARLASLRQALEARDMDAALTQLRRLVPDYTPSQALLALSRQSAQRVAL